MKPASTFSAKRAAKYAARGAMLALAVMVLAPVLHAQAFANMEKKEDISVFAAYTYTTPDYGPKDNTGATVGVDFTRYFGWRVAPSLELRGYETSGNTVKENGVLGGIRLSTDYRHRYHPYIHVLGGIMVLKYNFMPAPGYISDRGNDLAYGAGIDIDIVHGVSFKGDFLYQSVDITGRLGDISLTPSNTSIGISYRIPFRGDEAANKVGKPRPEPPPAKAAATAGASSGNVPVSDQPPPPPPDQPAATPTPSSTSTTTTPTSTTDAGPVSDQPPPPPPNQPAPTPPTTATAPPKY